MNDLTLIFISIFLICFTLIGIKTNLKNDYSSKNFFLANKGLSPFLVGVSSFATNNSGYMFIGFIGFTYINGLSAAWLILGWILGDIIASIFYFKKINLLTADKDHITYPELLSTNVRNTSIKKIFALISLCFLIFYGSGQLIAVTKAMSTFININFFVACFIITLIVLSYSLRGGIKSSINTDIFQAFLMLFSLVILIVITIIQLGGVNIVINEMILIDSFMDLSPKFINNDSIFFILFFGLSWLFSGFSVLGQPHIITRFMALKNIKKINSARFWYYSIYSIFGFLALFIGLLCKIYFINTPLIDPEVALPKLALEIMNPFFLSIIFIGIVSGSISTADSILVNCISNLYRDILEIKKLEKIKVLAIGLLISSIIFALACFGSKSVFYLVNMSWAALASAFIPIIISIFKNIKLSFLQALLVTTTGLTTSILWGVFGLTKFAYQGLPGILSGLIVLFFISLKNKRT
jgi:sodium/proline symporter